CVKWYTLNPLNPVMGAVLQEEAFGFTDSYVYAPTVAVSENGNAIFVFNSSDANHFVGVYAVGRDGRDPLSTVQIGQNLLLKPGVDVYTRGAPGIRSSADIDPIDDNRFWFIGAYPSGKFLPCRDGSANYDWATWAAFCLSPDRCRFCRHQCRTRHRSKSGSSWGRLPARCTSSRRLSGDGRRPSSTTVSPAVGRRIIYEQHNYSTKLFGGK